MKTMTLPSSMIRRLASITRPFLTPTSRRGWYNQCLLRYIAYVGFCCRFIVLCPERCTEPSGGFRRCSLPSVVQLQRVSSGWLCKQRTVDGAPKSTRQPNTSVSVLVCFLSHVEQFCLETPTSTGHATCELRPQDYSLAWLLFLLKRLRRQLDIRLGDIQSSISGPTVFDCVVSSHLGHVYGRGFLVGVYALRRNLDNNDVTTLRQSSFNSLPQLKDL